MKVFSSVSTCPTQGPLRHGNIVCDNGRKVGSKCDFTCWPEYQLYPPTAGAPSVTAITTTWNNNRCLSTGQWSRAVPCCAREWLYLLFASNTSASQSFSERAPFVPFMDPTLTPHIPIVPGKLTARKAIRSEVWKTITDTNATWNLQFCVLPTRE